MRRLAAESATNEDILVSLVMHDLSSRVYLQLVTQCIIFAVHWFSVKVQNAPCSKAVARCWMRVLAHCVVIMEAAGYRHLGYSGSNVLARAAKSVYHLTSTVSVRVCVCVCVSPVTKSPRKRVSFM